MACVSGPAGWDARRRAIHCVAAPPEVLSLRSLYCGAMEGAPASDGSAKAENASLAKECGHPRTGGAEACRATMPHPQGGARAPFWAFCYVITDLRIYPPPSPSHAPPVRANVIAERAANETLRSDSVECVAVKDLLNDLRCMNSTVSPMMIRVASRRYLQRCTRPPRCLIHGMTHSTARACLARLLARGQLRGSPQREMQISYSHVTRGAGPFKLICRPWWGPTHPPLVLNLYPIQRTRAVGSAEPGQDDAGG
jgi:hypothetical protein